jgi:hypothetical protein
MTQKYTESNRKQWAEVGFNQRLTSKKIII